MVVSLVQLWNTGHMPNKMSVSNETFGQPSTQIIVSKNLV